MPLLVLLLASAGSAESRRPMSLPPDYVAKLMPFARTGPSSYSNPAMVYTYVDLTHASRGLSHSADAMDSG